jgi:hypothetical protein
MVTYNRAVALIGAALIALIFTLANLTPTAEASHGHRVLRACLTDEGESAFPCVWHSLSMGNGQGHSFRIFRDGRVKQINHRWAFHLLGDCDSNGPIYCRSSS